MPIDSGSCCMLFSAVSGSTMGSGCSIGLRSNAMEARSTAWGVISCAGPAVGLTKRAEGCSATNLPACSSTQEARDRGAAASNLTVRRIAVDVNGEPACVKLAGITRTWAHADEEKTRAANAPSAHIEFRGFAIMPLEVTRLLLSEFPSEPL